MQLGQQVDTYMRVQQPSRWRLAVSTVVPVRMREAWRVTGPPSVDFGAVEIWWQWRGREFGHSARRTGSPGVD